MGNPSRKKGKSGNRKYGRKSSKPSHMRYNAERRWEKNKARRIAKQARKEAKKADRKANQ
ncbi:MAG: hypothetical protein K9L62_10580 [Vallitaleaceae bacterium]|nr:hypothetical protein [Vallitaleaceae bacterium]